MPFFILNIMYNKMKPKILFILKKRHVYGDYPSVMSSGLYNSANFVSQMLNEYFDSKLVEVIDGNGIDKEVYNFKPDFVFIEAIWCPPSKFNELQKLHPKVKWIIRIHSEIPFLANEGIALNWIKEYLQYENVFISFNSKNTNKEFQKLYNKNKIIYLPNYYSLDKEYNKRKPNKNQIHIGCFGAIRPMKNQLLQAIAAINFANKIGKTLYFHINSTRTEQKGENVLKNLKALFDKTPHNLVEWSWLNHDEFINLVKTMDLGMQASMSESFNIVSADFVNNEIPIVTSNEIKWIFPLFKAKPTKFKSIYNKLFIAYYGKFLGIHNLNKIGLYLYSFNSKNIWYKFITKENLIKTTFSKFLSYLSSKLCKFNFKKLFNKC